MSRQWRVAIAVLILSLAVFHAGEEVGAGSEECPRATSERLPLNIRETPRFEADLAYFAVDPETYRLEAWLSVMNDDLQFLKRDGRYRALYEITVIAEDRSARQVKGDQVRRERWVDRYEATNQTETVVADLLTLSLPPGEFNIVLRVRDVGSGVESEGRQKVVLPRGGDDPWFSSFRFLEGAPDAGGDPGEPDAWVGRAYGDSLPVMRAYVELYGPGVNQPSVELVYETADPEHDRIAMGKGRRLESAGFGAPFLVELRTDSLSVGVYDLKATARQDDEVLAVMCGSFRVSSSSALWLRDYDEMLDLLSYIGTGDELDRLKEAPEDGRRKAREEFWAGRDPTPGTSRNETREIFFERVAYANRNFGEMLAEGWHTDRGRIYITEGPPDSIESHPMDLSGNPWEAWYYNRRGIVYIFVDRSGFGEYVLVGTR